MSTRLLGELRLLGSNTRGLTDPPRPPSDGSAWGDLAGSSRGLPGPLSLWVFPKADLLTAVSSPLLEMPQAPVKCPAPGLRRIAHTPPPIPASCLLSGPRSRGDWGSGGVVGTQHPEPRQAHHMLPRVPHLRGTSLCALEGEEARDRQPRSEARKQERPELGSPYTAFTLP